MDPVLFLPNRVRRLYLGGSGIDRLRGSPAPADGHFPEDWIASCVRANSRDVPPDHGLSLCRWRGAEWSFPDLLARHGDELLGPAHLARFGCNPGFLCKLLDAAMRLPIQVHPDRAMAMRLFSSTYGKSEAWMTFAVRPVGGEEPYILLGFNERFDPAVFRRESEDGVYREGLEMLHRFAVRPGEVYLVPGRMPHAIGPGLTMVEVMEPSDITINPERTVCGVDLPPERRFARLGIDAAMSVFDAVPLAREQVLARCRPAPVVVDRRAAGMLSRRIADPAFPYFEAHELAVDGTWPLDLAARRCLRVGIVVSGRIRAGTAEIAAGHSFLVPWSCEALTIDGRATVILLSPPC